MKFIGRRGSLNIKHIAVALVVFFVVAVWFLWSIYNSSALLYSEATEVMTQMQKKRVTVSEMMRSARERTLNLFAMHISGDAFEIEDLNSEMIQEASNFLENKVRLERTNLTPHESELLEKALDLTSSNAVTQRRAVELMYEGKTAEAYELIHNTVVPVQADVLAYFESFLQSLEVSLLSEIERLDELHQKSTIYILIFLSLILLAAALVFIVFYIGFKKNEQKLLKLVSERTAELEQAYDQTRSLVQNSSDAIVSINSEQEIILFNPAAELMFGYSCNEAMGEFIDILLPFSVQQGHKKYVHDFSEDTGVQAKFMTARPEVAGRRKDGSTFPAEVSICKSPIGKEMYFTAFVRDVTEKYEAEKTMRQLAMMDALTGLQNRYYFEESLRETIAYQKRHSDYDFCLLLIDLDGFKSVNDTYGHLVGDELLKIVANILKNNVREGDSVSRFGGDEFAILMRNPGSCLHAEKVANKLIHGLSQPQNTCGHIVNIGATIGISCFSYPPADPDSVIREADRMLYAGKAAGKNTFRVYQG